MPVAIPCEAWQVHGQCTTDATVRRNAYGTCYALCDFHRTFPNSRLALRSQDPWSLYHRIHPRAGRKVRAA